MCHELWDACLRWRACQPAQQHCYRDNAQCCRTRLQVHLFNPAFDAPAVAATAALMRHDVTRVAFAMGASEFEELDGEAGWQALRAVAQSGRCRRFASSFLWCCVILGPVHCILDAHECRQRYRERAHWSSC